MFTGRQRLSIAGRSKKRASPATRGQKMTSDRETQLNVTGMTCHSCVRHVDDALRELAGVHKVQVQLREGKVLVKHDPQSAPVSAMMQALQDAGYDSTPLA
jgi:copper chaperone